MLWVRNSGRAFLRGWAERSRSSRSSPPCDDEERAPVEGAAGAKALSQEEVGVSGADRQLEHGANNGVSLQGGRGDWHLHMCNYTCAMTVS